MIWEYMLLALVVGIIIDAVVESVIKTYFREKRKVQ